MAKPLVRKVHAKFWPWGMPWYPCYDHFCVPCCHPTCKSLQICWFSIIYEVRLSCVRVAFDMRLRCILHASEVRLSCVWSAFEMRSRRVWGAWHHRSHRHHPQDINRVRALSLQGRYENRGRYIYIYVYVYLLSPPEDLPRPLKLLILIIFNSLWVYQNLWRHNRKHCVKVSLLETLCGSKYDHFWFSCWPSYS